MAKLRIKQLSKRFGKNVVLDRVNLAVKEGEITVIIGKSGTGKTTLLLCLVGFLVPNRGSASSHGVELLDLPVQARQLAYMPQDYALFPHLNVAGNIGFGLTVRRVDARTRERKVRSLMKTVELPAHFAQRSVVNLSGGEKQRVALARALAVEPRAFLLDEPLSAIDRETKHQVAAQLRALLKLTKIPTIIVMHDEDEATLVADTIWRLENGKLKKV